MGKIVQLHYVFLCLVGTLIGSDPHFSVTIGGGVDQQNLTVNFKAYEAQLLQYQNSVKGALCKPSMAWVNDSYASTVTTLTASDNLRKKLYQECAVCMRAYDKRKIQHGIVLPGGMTNLDYAKWLLSDNCNSLCAKGLMLWLEQWAQGKVSIGDLSGGHLYNVNLRHIEIYLGAHGQVNFQVTEEFEKQLMHNIHVAKAYSVEKSRRSDFEKQVAREQELKSVYDSVKHGILSALTRKIDACERQRVVDQKLQEEKLKREQLAITLADNQTKWIDEAIQLEQAFIDEKEKTYDFHSHFISPVIARYAAGQHERILAREQGQKLQNRYETWLKTIKALVLKQHDMANRWFASSADFCLLLPEVEPVSVMTNAAMVQTEGQVFESKDVQADRPCDQCIVFTEQIKAQNKQLRWRAFGLGLLREQIERLRHGGSVLQKHITAQEAVQHGLRMQRAELNNKLRRMQQDHQRVATGLHDQIRRLNDRMRDIAQQFNQKSQAYAAQSGTLDVVRMKLRGAEQDACRLQQQLVAQQQTGDLLRQQLDECIVQKDRQDGLLFVERGKVIGLNNLVRELRTQFSEIEQRYRSMIVERHMEEMRHRHLNNVGAVDGGAPRKFW